MNTTFVGKITTAEPRYKHNPGRLGLHWTEAILPGGARVEIHGSLSNSEGVKEHTVTGSQAKGKGVKGLGAAVGGGIGVLAGGLKGLIIGGAAGYGAGAAAQGKTTDVTLKAGTRLNMVLNRDAVLPGRR